MRKAMQVERQEADKDDAALAKWVLWLAVALLIGWFAGYYVGGHEERPFEMFSLDHNYGE